MCLAYLRIGKKERPMRLKQSKESGRRYGFSDNTIRLGKELYTSVSSWLFLEVVGSHGEKG